MDTAGECAGSGWRCHEADEGGLSGLCRLVFCDPVGDAAEVDRRRRENLLKVGLGRTDIAAAAQAVGAHRLRQRAFDAGGVFVPR